ncbi:DUF2278 family protein [Pseudooceanicola marinus]|uniref:DUF2278 family protein n=1 Tax=Pseudooceanicola marinus TaxID=396013 RepID=UPI001CD1BEB2|nr:DUF2278 family protein [Pseudooceanicola marinus]MCA1334745.1 DUF2278 family protein [Pseudooceanicola marinus]
MPITHYGVWTGTPVRVDAERADQDAESPHIHLYFEDGTPGRFDGAKQAAINVKSLTAVSELVYWHLPDLRHPLTQALAELPDGFRRLTSKPGGAALDYIRSNILDFSAGRVLPHDLPGRQPNDLIDFVLPELRAAIALGARVHLLGEPYDDLQGLHDLHMNQGSHGRFRKDNGPWQDGAVLLHYPHEDRYAGLFFAFVSQAVHTHDRTGHPLPGAESFADLLGFQAAAPEAGTAGWLPEAPPALPDRRVAIMGALVNPRGSDIFPEELDQPESVYLVNRSAEGLSLAGWSIVNTMGEARVLSGDAWLAPGAVLTVPMKGVSLSNRGGTITLLDPAGLKADGVSYTAAEGKPEGRILTFRPGY